MARDYDSQLLESVAVRRKRLREAVLFGPQRTRRRLDENIAKIIAGLVVSAVACAGSVGWSFLQNQLSSQEEAAQAQERVQSPPPPAPSAPVPADWVGAEVTMDMLAAQLDSAGVPPELYVLPDEARPAAGTATSYFLLTESERGYSAGIVEYEQGRTGADFPTEDEAARWLYGELVLVDADPRPLGTSEEDKAAKRTAKLADDARAKIRQGSGDSVNTLLKPGMLVDTFGQEGGSLLFPDGQPFRERGLPDIARPSAASDTSPAPDTSPSGAPAQTPSAPSESADAGAGAEADADSASGGYHRYRVTHPFKVDASLSPSEGANPGGGVRFTIEAGGFVQPPALLSIRWLLGNGYLERVEASEVPA
ncbi:TNT domain-containing protein [Streptomonospora wellingtoniae]|uniref:TNT domain-containing protein n=1 Tax=Streptomonospora wellingtoniae TaxID=3075544 RepID=A0ABU2KY48_9ACTN|nr:TNT domain-containing protein [Streptomonospora sp. DSM 45055]MDT0304231.1 TNT domain-containing protein [Streptomonospora sp. DSM 45055]